MHDFYAHLMNTPAPKTTDYYSSNLDAMKEAILLYRRLSDSPPDHSEFYFKCLQHMINVFDGSEDVAEFRCPVEERIGTGTHVPALDSMTLHHAMELMNAAAIEAVSFFGNYMTFEQSMSSVQAHADMLVAKYYAFKAFLSTLISDEYTFARIACAHARMASVLDGIPALSFGKARVIPPAPAGFSLFDGDKPETDPDSGSFVVSKPKCKTLFMHYMADELCAQFEILKQFPNPFED